MSSPVGMTEEETPNSIVRRRENALIVVEDCEGRCAQETSITKRREFARYRGGKFELGPIYRWMPKGSLRTFR